MDYNPYNNFDLVQTYTLMNKINHGTSSAAQPRWLPKELMQTVHEFMLNDLLVAIDTTSNKRYDLGYNFRTRRWFKIPKRNIKTGFMDHRINVKWADAISINSTLMIRDDANPSSLIMKMRPLPLTQLFLRVYYNKRDNTFAVINITAPNQYTDPVPRYSSCAGMLDSVFLSICGARYVRDNNNYMPIVPFPNTGQVFTGPLAEITTTHSDMASVSIAQGEFKGVYLFGGETGMHGTTACFKISSDLNTRRLSDMPTVRLMHTAVHLQRDNMIMIIGGTTAREQNCICYDLARDAWITDGVPQMSTSRIFTKAAYSPVTNTVIAFGSDQTGAESPRYNPAEPARDLLDISDVYETLDLNHPATERRWISYTNDDKDIKLAKHMVYDVIKASV